MYAGTRIRHAPAGRAIRYIFCAMAQKDAAPIPAREIILY